MKKTDIPFSPVLRLLRGYGVNAVQLATILGVSYNTASARLRRPDTLTLREIGLISSRAGIPIEEVRAAIRR